MDGLFLGRLSRHPNLKNNPVEITDALLLKMYEKLGTIISEKSNLDEKLLCIVSVYVFFAIFIG